MELFDDIIRLSLSDAQGMKLTKYQKLNQLTSDEIDEERNRINQLFDIIADDDKAKFKKDLISDYDSGKFELEVYESFIRYGFRISKDLNYNGKTPDLTIEKDGHKFIVECTLLRPPVNEVAYENLRNDIEAKINKLQVLDRGINIISMKLLTNSQPSIKGFIRHLEKSLPTQPLNERQVFKRKDYSIEYKPYEVKSLKTALIVASMSETRVVGAYHDAERFRDSFVGKAKKYKDIGLPYIICIKSLDHYVSKDDIWTAIQGGSVYNLDTKETSMMNDGIFTSLVKSYERVSAMMYKTGNSDLHMVLNPRAKTSFPTSILTNQSQDT